MTLAIHKLPQGDRAPLALSIRKAAIASPGHFVPDLPAKNQPHAQFTAQQWFQFFSTAGWPEKDARALSDGPTDYWKPPPRAVGVQAALRKWLNAGNRATLDTIVPKFPQWSRCQIQCGLTHLRDQKEAKKCEINQVWSKV